jgi:hypothetical protein
MAPSVHSHTLESRKELKKKKEEKENRVSKADALQDRPISPILLASGTNCAAEHEPRK